MKVWLIAALLTLVSCPAPAHPLLDEITSTVQREFYDPNLRGVPLQQLAAPLSAPLQQARSWDEKARICNQLLAHLKTSHTYFYSPESKGYHELLGVFGGLGNRRYQKLSVYSGISMDTLETEGKTFIKGLWDGLAGERAGLRVGDEIVSVDGSPYHEIRSFQGKSSVQISLRRSRGGPLQSVRVAVSPIDPAAAFEKALRQSAKVVDFRGRKLAYVHVWNYAGERYQDALQEVITRPPLSDCDGLVLDLRDGWGGAQPQYLNLFNSKVPVVTMRTRASHHWGETQWRKPVVCLVNAATRSGKEILAYGFQRYGIGPVVGEKTPGMVVGGRPYLLPSGGLLYLAVADVTVDGQRLEGVGVEPDIKVGRPIPYCNGADPQKERALEVLTDELRKTSQN